MAAGAIANTATLISVGGSAAAVAQSAGVAVAAVGTSLAFVKAGVLAVEGWTTLFGNITFSKNNPNGHNPNPTSWLNRDMGLDALKRNNGNSVNATKDLLNQRYGEKNWTRSNSREFNAIHKWLDRIIRSLLR